MQDFNWKKLQNGSDIRGVAIDGVPGEPVNLTAEVVRRLGQAFTVWLAGKLGKPTGELQLAVGRDSRISGARRPARCGTWADCLGSSPGCRWVCVGSLRSPA